MLCIEHPGKHPIMSVSMLRQPGRRHIETDMGAMPPNPSAPCPFGGFGGISLHVFRHQHTRARCTVQSGGGD